MLQVDKPGRKRNRKIIAPSNLEGVTPAILAGGLGTRLRPVLFDRPKVLAEVHQRPYLTFLFDQLIATGFREVVLLTGFQSDQVLQMLGQSYGPLKLVHSSEAAPLGTGGALRNGLTKLNCHNVLLLNGDSWCDADLGDFGNFHRLSGGDLSLVLVKEPDSSRFGKVNAAPDGRVSHFEEKTDGGPCWINAGIYLLACSLIAEIPAGATVSLERDMIPQWLGQGKKVYGYRHAGRFLDIGTPASYAAAETFIPHFGKTPGPPQLVRKKPAMKKEKLS